MTATRSRCKKGVRKSGKTSAGKRPCRKVCVKGKRKSGRRCVKRSRSPKRRSSKRKRRSGSRKRKRRSSKRKRPLNAYMRYAAKHRSKVMKRFQKQGLSGRRLISKLGKTLGKMYRAQKK